MVNIELFLCNLKKYLQMEISKIATSTPLVSFMSPLISRALTNAIDRLSQPLLLIADKEGNIDVSNILSEMSQNLVNTQPFVVNIPSIGPLYIGNGTIKIDIPYTNKNLMLDQNDLNNLKEILTYKN